MREEDVILVAGSGVIEIKMQWHEKDAEERGREKRRGFQEGNVCNM